MTMNRVTMSAQWTRVLIKTLSPLQQPFKPRIAGTRRGSGAPCSPLTMKLCTAATPWSSRKFRTPLPTMKTILITICRIRKTTRVSTRRRKITSQERGCYRCHPRQTSTLQQQRFRLCTVGTSCGPAQCAMRSVGCHIHHHHHHHIISLSICHCHRQMLATMLPATTNHHPPRLTNNTTQYRHHRRQRHFSPNTVLSANLHPLQTAHLSESTAPEHADVGGGTDSTPDAGVAADESSEGTYENRQDDREEIDDNPYKNADENDLAMQHDVVQHGDSPTDDAQATGDVLATEAPEEYVHGDETPLGFLVKAVETQVSASTSLKHVQWLAAASTE